MGCSWSCSTGYTKVGGSYCSSDSSCSIGQYYSSLYSSCQSCTNKPSSAYYTSSGGSSSVGCSWSCSTGYVNVNGYCTYGTSNSQNSGPVTGATYSTYYSLAADTVNAMNKLSQIIAGVLGAILLLTIAVVLVVMRARPLESPPGPHSCACLHGYHAKLRCLLAAAALALTTLALTLASDSESQLCDIDRRFRLMLAALGLHVVGCIALYSLSDCGCALCLCCRCGGCCDRTIQATTAIGCSLTFWFLAIGPYAYVVYALDFCNALVKDSSLQEICLLSRSFVPLGIGPWCGILSAAAMLLQGHFVSLVPEAIAALSPPASTQPAPGDTELVFLGNAAPPVTVPGKAASEPVAVAVRVVESTTLSAPSRPATAPLGAPNRTNWMV